MKKFLISFFCIAAVLLSCNYSYGEEVEDVEIIIKKAEQGDAQAQFNLGRMYINGRGVSKDINELNILNYGITKLYNAKGSRKGFIQAFMRHYNIPNLKFKKKGVYEYSNEKEGWAIQFSNTENCEVVDIEIYEIEKVENFKF